MFMTESRKPFNFPTLCRLSALTLFVGASTFALQAQQVGPQLVSSTTTNPLNLASAAGIDYSSSTSDVASPVNPAAADHLALFTGAGQPPPRRRYGRPRYNDNMHNADGSSKYTFIVGVGFTGAVGNTFHYLNTNYAAQVGAGRNFNKNFAVMAQFDYDRFGFNGRTLYNEQSLYNYGLSSTSAYYIPNLDGSSHIWSFSLNPVYNIYSGPGLGAYLVAGVGFYHKVADFTIPVTQSVCYYYSGCYAYTANQTISHYSSNAPGANGGIGLTFKPGRFSGEHLFAEARYVIINNSQRKGLTVSNINTAYGQTYGGYNYYPANSNRTTYLAYKFGVRF